ncbi:MAG TPA: hypothetical protein VNW97_14405 [Candidatus Saccharimonadales bacterium]|jgi:hypothetical protein|nr:hypothetical protein [Candidatus Saccharimonadales bacterium]
MWRGILRYCGEMAIVVVVLIVLERMNANDRFFPLVILAYVFVADLGRKLDKMDKKLETLAKKLNVSLEEAPQKEEKKIILTE